MVHWFHNIWTYVPSTNGGTVVSENQMEWYFAAGNEDHDIGNIKTGKGDMENETNNEFSLEGYHHVEAKRTIPLSLKEWIIAFTQ